MKKNWLDISCSLYDIDILIYIVRHRRVGTMLILIREIDIQNSVTVANYGYNRSFSCFAVDLNGKLFYIAWNATADSLPISSKKNLPTLRNPLKIHRVWRPRTPIIVPYLLLGLTGLRWDLVVWSTVFLYVPRLILPFDVVTVKVLRIVLNCKAPRCVILSIPITSCLLFPNNH